MITYIPGNVEIPYEGIKNGANYNDDGHGWAVASKKFGLQIGKDMDFYKSFEKFEEARESHGPDSLAMFHSRMATHGSTDEFNIHPFYVKDENTVMAHNGILSSLWQPKKGDRRSDTRIFADRTLPNYLTERGIPSRRGGRDLGRLIGTGNKLVIMSIASGEPKVRIVNSHLGQHSGGVWYSNDWYCTTRSYAYTGYSGSSYTNYSGWGGSSAWDTDDARDQEFLDWWTQRKAESGDQYFSSAPCEICYAEGTVDLDTSWCEYCDSCNDCWAVKEHCTCSANKVLVEALNTKEVEALVAPKMLESSTSDRWVKDEETGIWHLHGLADFTD
jgi:glutamine amidotransferase